MLAGYTTAPPSVRYEGAAMEGGSTSTLPRDRIWDMIPFAHAQSLQSVGREHWRKLSKAELGGELAREIGEYGQKTAPSN